jgi:hypothetical protein
MSRGGEISLRRCCCLRVGGVAGLGVKGAVEESVCDGGLAWATVLAATEASELGGLNGDAWRWELEKMWAGEDRGREGRVSRMI